MRKRFPRQSRFGFRPRYSTMVCFHPCSLASPGAHRVAARWPWCIFNKTFLLVILVCVVLHGCHRDSSDEQKKEQINRMYETYRESFPTIHEMTVTEFLTVRNTGDAVLVDVREPFEQQVSIIPGSIILHDFERNRERYREKTIVAYCTIGQRSGEYARKWAEQDYSVWNLKGGILAWAHAGQEVVDRNGRTQRVHVYGRKWNLLPHGYEAVW
jgi:rhodanese-related sulfurtransferase